MVRSSHPQVFLWEGEHLCQSVISIKLQGTLLKSHFGMGVSCKFLYIFRTPFLKNTSGWLLLNVFVKNSIRYFRSSRPEVFLGKSALKICSKFTGEHPCRSAIWKKLLFNFYEIALSHGCSPVNLRNICRTVEEWRSMFEVYWAVHSWLGKIIFITIIITIII